VSNNYSWISEKKKEAMMQKLQQRGMPNYRQLTPQDKYGVSFTGLGQNGQLDRNAPAGVDQGAVFHEGEMRANIPEGQMYANADMTQMMNNPRTIQERGFAAGGFNPEGSFLTQQAKKAKDAVVSNISNMSMFQQPRTVAERNMQQPVTPVSNQVQPAVVQNNIPTQPQIAGRRTVETPAVTPVSNQIQPGTITNSIPQITQPQVAEVKTVEQPTAVQNQVQLAGTQEDQAREKGMNWFLDALNKENPALMLEGRRAASELSSRQQQERSAAEQQLLQQGVDPGRARLEGQILRDKQESELNDLAAQYGIAGMQARQEIAGTLATQGLQGQQFEDDKKRYGDSADWKAYETAIAAGDFDTAAKAYQTVTGKPISMDQMKTYQTYLNTKNQQDIATGDITINRLKNDLGNDIAASVQDRINSGRSLEQINAEFPNAKLTMAEFQNMYDTTPTGQRSFERNLGFANTLLQAEDGKGTNTASAVKILEELFPGTGIDFSGVVTTQKAATFNQGMSQLSDYVTAGMDWEEAITAIEKNGTLEMLGLDKTATEKLYRGLKVNAIDEQLKAITDSELLTDEEKADAKTFATAVLTGQLDYKIQKEYTVTDKDGKVTTMYMDSSAAATYATSNPGTSVVGTGKSKVVPITDILDEDGETTEVPDAAGKTQGTVFLENGKTWKVGADGKAKELPIPTEIWGSDADSILKAGREGNPYYDEIMEQRYNEMNDVREADMTLMDSAVAYEKSTQFQTRADSRLRAAAAWNTEFTKYKKYSFDDPVVQKLKDELAKITDLIFIVKDGNSWKFDYKK
jgi:hypothetical protein